MIRGVTVVTAAYRINSLKNAYECVKGQSYGRIEHIVVNDSQSDISNWLSSEGKNILGVNLGRRFGRYGLYGRNVGAMLAHYDRILFLDEDNLWPADFVEKMVQAEESAGKIPYCGLKIVGKIDPSYERDKETLFQKQKIDLGCLLYRKEFFSKYGYFRDDKSCHSCFDWDLIRRIHEGEGGDKAFVKVDTRLIFSHKRR